MSRTFHRDSMSALRSGFSSTRGGRGKVRKEGIEDEEDKEDEDEDEELEAEVDEDADSGE